MSHPDQRKSADPAAELAFYALLNEAIEFQRAVADPPELLTPLEKAAIDYAASLDKGAKQMIARVLADKARKR